MNLSYKIKGNIEGLSKGRKLYLILEYGYSFRTVDRCRMGMGGTFKFGGTSAGPEWALVSLNRDSSGTSFILDKGIINVNGKFIDGEVKIFPVKSPENNVYFEFRHDIAPIDSNIEKIRKFYTTYKEDKVSLKATFYHNVLTDLYKKEHKIFGNYIKRKPLAFFCLEYIYSNTFSVPDNFILKIYIPYSKELKNTPLGRLFYDRYILSTKIAQVSNLAPNIIEETPSGDTIALSSFKGKWTLIDFWASWCGPCREKNPLLKKLYAKYKNDGFEILGVSLDKKSEREAWIKAIKEDNLPWPQVSELNGWDNSARLMYGFNSIPFLILVDPKEVIVKKFSYNNLDELQKDISVYLK